MGVEDCKEPVINVEPSKLFFKGAGGPDKKQHELTINFFGEIDKEKSKFAVRDRVIEFALEKKDSGPYWKRLRRDDETNGRPRRYARWYARRHAWYGYARG